MKPIARHFYPKRFLIATILGITAIIGGCSGASLNDPAETTPKLGDCALWVLENCDQDGDKNAWYCNEELFAATPIEELKARIDASENRLDDLEAVKRDLILEHLLDDQ